MHYCLLCYVLAHNVYRDGKDGSPVLGIFPCLKWIVPPTIYVHELCRILTCTVITQMGDCEVTFPHRDVEPVNNTFQHTEHIRIKLCMPTRSVTPP